MQIIAFFILHTCIYFTRACMNMPENCYICNSNFRI
jgi:hypothetical protein